MTCSLIRGWNERGDQPPPEEADWLVEDIAGHTVEGRVEGCVSTGERDAR